MEEQDDLVGNWAEWEGESDLRLSGWYWMSLKMVFLEVGSTYPGNEEQGMFNDVGKIELEVSSILSYVHIALRPCANLDGLHSIGHSGHLFDPPSPGKLPPDPAS